MPKPRAAVVGVGDELLAGVVVNTNAAFIGERMQELGIPVGLSVCVGDVEDEIVRVLGDAMALAHVVIVTGGLGPTEDDRTREALARLMGVPLVRDPSALRAIRERFEAMGRVMAPSNERQADCPAGAALIPNPWGTAPGIRVDAGDKVLLAIPGVPREAQRMLDEQILPMLRERYPDLPVIRTRTIRCCGIPEADLAGRLRDLSAAPEPRLAFLPGGGEVRLRFVATGTAPQDCEDELDRCEAVVRERCGSVVYAVGDTSMERVVAGLLTQRGLTVATAESCTAGLVSSRLGAVPGASSYLQGAIVAYQPQVKVSTLGVTPEMLDAAGAVSEEVALEMARGARRMLGADFGLSVTCSAGPAPQDEALGTTFIGLCGPDGLQEVRHLRIPGDRDQIRLFASTFALNLLRLHLEPAPPG